MYQGPGRITSPSPSPKIRRGQKEPLRQCVRALEPHNYFRIGAKKLPVPQTEVCTKLFSRSTDILTGPIPPHDGVDTPFAISGSSRANAKGLHRPNQNDPRNLNSHLRPRRGTIPFSISESSQEQCYRVVSDRASSRARMTLQQRVREVDESCRRCRRRFARLVPEVPPVYYC
jgi:hypothetical protein